MSLLLLPPKNADGSVPDALCRYAAWRCVRFVTPARFGDFVGFLINPNGTTSVDREENTEPLMPTVSGAAPETVSCGGANPFVASGSLIWSRKLNSPSVAPFCAK